MKVCLKLVLKVLMQEQKKERVFIAEMFLNDCEADPTLLGWIFTGDESWIFEYDPSTKRQSMQGRGATNHGTKKLAWLDPIRNLLILFFEV